MKKLFATTLIAALTFTTVLAGCGKTAEAEKPATDTSSAVESISAEPVTETKEEIDFTKLTKEDIDIFYTVPSGEKEDEKDQKKKYVDDDETVYVLQGTKEFDPANVMYYDDTVVTGIKSDDSKVDYTKVGTYDVTYEVSLNKEAYTAYKEDPKAHTFNFVPVYKDKDEKVNEAVTATSSTSETKANSSSAANTASTKPASLVKSVKASKDDAVVKVTGEVVIVVTAKDAKEKAKDNIPVYTNEYKLAEESVAMPTPAEITKAAEKTAAETPAATKTPDASQESSQTSQTDNTEQGGNTQPAHEHNWVTEQIETSPAWDEQVLVKDAWDEQVLVREDYDETVCVKEAWDEEVIEMHMICSSCGLDYDANGLTMQEEEDHQYMHALNGDPGGEHSEGVSVFIHHDAEYQTIHHDAEYQTVHHDAEYKTVHHDATYSTVTRCSGCGATK